MRVAVMSRLHDEESGFTIVELLIACVLGVIILGSATQITIGAVRHNEEVANRVDATQRGRLAMENMQRLLRTQVCTTASPFPISAALADSVTFTADTSDGSTPPKRHAFAFDAGQRQLTDTVWAGSTASPITFPGTGSAQLLATDVERTGSQAVFRYYRYPATVPATDPLEPNVEMVPTATGLSATDLGKVARIDINFRTTGAATRTRNIKAQQTDQVFVRIANPNDVAASFNPSCA